MTFIKDASIKEIKQEVRHLVEIHSLDRGQCIYGLSQFFDICDLLAHDEWSED